MRLGLGVSQVCTSTAGGVDHCTRGVSPGIQAIVIVALAPIVLAPTLTAVFLAKRARTATPTG